MHLVQKARTKYMVKNGNQQQIKPPTIIANVFAAFVSMRKRFAWSFRTRFAAPRFVLPLPSRFKLFSRLLAPSSGLHRNVSIFSLRFNVICIICKMGLLCVRVSSSHSSCNRSTCLGIKHGFRSNDVVSQLADFLLCFRKPLANSRGILFDRRPRWIRNVTCDWLSLCCFDPEIWFEIGF